MVSAALIGISLSMDAFAIALASGLSVPGFCLRDALKMSVFFGFFQFIMPLLGYFLAGTLREHVEKFGPYISFVLLAFIGGRMVVGALQKKNPASEKAPARLTVPRLFALAVATSIDAFAVGVSFAFMDVSLLSACVIIGAVTFALCMIGSMLSNRIPGVSGRASEILGGLVLTGIGVKLLIDGVIR